MIKKFDTWPFHFSNDSGQVVHTHASVTKQYDLLQVKRHRWGCPAAGKMTVWRHTGHAWQT